MSLTSNLLRLTGLRLGELGSKTNPIRCDSASGEKDYLARLRDKRGKAPKFARIGNVGEGPHGNVLDLYVVESDCMSKREIYMDMYHRGYVELKPILGLFIFNLAEIELSPPAKDAGVEQLTAFAQKLGKACKPDAVTLQVLLDGKYTLQQCSQILVFGVSLIMFSYGPDREKVVDGLLRNASLNLTPAAAELTYSFISGE